MGERPQPGSYFRVRFPVRAYHTTGTATPHSPHSRASLPQALGQDEVSVRVYISASGSVRGRRIGHCRDVDRRHHDLLRPRSQTLGGVEGVKRLDLGDRGMFRGFSLFRALPWLPGEGGDSDEPKEQGSGCPKPTTYTPGTCSCSEVSALKGTRRRWLQLPSVSQFSPTLTYGLVIVFSVSDKKPGVQKGSGVQLLQLGSDQSQRTKNFSG